ncbi:MAG: YqjF family protein [Candidatus Rokuibacteriota bacterium]
MKLDAAAPARGFLTAEWRYLAMINYEIDPRVLRSRVPAGTELDAWQGRTFVSLVGFLFVGTRVYGWSIPFHRNFEEVNLRFYVRRRDNGGWRRGVAFIKEIVPRAGIAAVARLLYNEAYVALPMRHSIEADTGSPPGRVEYGWSARGRWNRLTVRAGGEPRETALGSQEQFITEHYWGYTVQRDGGSIEYQVEHPPWRVWPVSEAFLDCDVASLYGQEFATALGAQPSSAFLAEGSPVTVREGRRL